MPLHTHESGDKGADKVQVRPQFTQSGEVADVPRFRLAPNGIPAPAAYQVVHDELLLDGNARLNLATFVTTWMEKEAEALMAECADKNLVDKDEYPQTAELERRCVPDLGRPDAAGAVDQRLRPQVRPRVPGAGWVVWRDAAALPDDLIFRVDYLGGEMPTFALNFSRPGAQVAAQYYSFVRLGFDGYRLVHQQSRDTAQWLAGQIGSMAAFELVSGGDGIPAFAFRVNDEEPYSVYDVSETTARASVDRARLPHASRHRRHARAAHRGPRRLHP